MSAYQDDQLLTPKQVAEYLGVHINSLQMWRKEGRGPDYINLGVEGSKRPHLVYRFGDVKDWVERRTIRVNDGVTDKESAA